MPIAQAAEALSCISCAHPLTHSFVDLGMSPLCESFVSPERLNEPETFYPLHARVCAHCLLVQVPPVVPREEIFTEYAYFSSYAESWVEHMRRYAEQAIEALSLDAKSLVVEVGSNDGYCLQHFIKRGVPALGIEPAANIARVAQQRGVPTLNSFFGTDVARRLLSEGKAADLICGANVLAQIPEPNDFVAGMAMLLKPGGVITIEFPHLLTLIEGNQFDTIYHEHFSYFSFLSVSRLFARHGLALYDVEELPTHGGSLRIWARRFGDDSRPMSSRAANLAHREVDLGFGEVSNYLGFGARAARTKRALLEFLFDAHRAGQRVAAYGAPGKGNTLLNYCGIGTDLIDFTVDKNPYKHGKYLPGSRIPIYPVEKLREERPDVVLVLPWNLADEISTQLSWVSDDGGKLVVPIPEVRVLPPRQRSAA